MADHLALPQAPQTRVSGTYTRQPQARPPAPMGEGQLERVRPAEWTPGSPWVPCPCPSAPPPSSRCPSTMTHRRLLRVPCSKRQQQLLYRELLAGGRGLTTGGGAETRRGSGSVGHRASAPARPRTQHCRAPFCPRPAPMSHSRRHEGWLTASAGGGHLRAPVSAPNGRQAGGEPTGREWIPAPARHTRPLSSARDELRSRRRWLWGAGCPQWEVTAPTPGPTMAGAHLHPCNSARRWRKRSGQHG